ncbi:hypothetical protein NSS82_09845 [Paenibacillus sp. FSL H7-0735]|uniref:hypothetical protein n=1 Tax=Paenibacillus sp. FSL H7-0735 TaxID=2954736 RepID=UPI0030F5ABE1
MQWEEVRKIYPHQYVKLQILASHTEGNTKLVDEFALIRAIQDPKKATKELLQPKDGVIVPLPQTMKLRLNSYTPWIVGSHAT